MADYVVKQHDTVWSIATANKDKIAGKNISEKVQTLISINKIKVIDNNIAIIVTGQEIYFSDPGPTSGSSGGSGSSSGSSSSKAKIELFGIVANTERTLYATWSWGKTEQTEKYEVQWLYDTGDGVWFIGSDTSTTHQQSTYTAPDNALKVKFKVKPVSKTYEQNTQTTASTSESSTTASVKDIVGALTSSPVTMATTGANAEMAAPNKPTISAGSNHVITVTADYSEQIKNGSTATHINWVMEVCRNGYTWESSLGGTSGYYTSIKDGIATKTYNVESGCFYRVKCRAYDNNAKKSSPWSPVSKEVQSSNASAGGGSSENKDAKDTGVLSGETQDGQSYFTASWSDERIFDFSMEAPPAKPNVPSVSMDGMYKLKAELDNIGDSNASHINFEVVRDNEDIITPTGGVNVAVTTAHVTYYCNVIAGSVYKVRCRSYNSKSKKYSDWTDYSSNVSTAPATPSGFTQCVAKTETSVYLTWDPIPTAKTYEIEYAIEKGYFDGSDATTTVSGIESTHYEKTGLESGQKYFFRLRAVNDGGTSGWSEISSVIIGEKPIAPTTWSSTTTVVSGEPLNLYWVHNSADGSSQTSAELEIYIGDEKTFHTILNSIDGDEKDKTSKFPVNTSQYVEGTKLQWRVRTAGIIAGEYGDWSVQRTVDIYAPPVLTLTVTNHKNEIFEILESFPINISGIAGPSTQTPMSYHVSVIAQRSYETVDNIGNSKWIVSGEELYSKHFDTSEQLQTSITAGDIDLENNMAYRINVVASMNSGLTAEAYTDFQVQWTEEIYEPNLEIGFTLSNFSTTLRPYCHDAFGAPVEGVSLAIYRREYDGGFTEIASGLDNEANAFVIDPHPSLDYARYRVVATHKNTGAISYYDVPGYRIGCNAIIIQWDEAWKSFNTINVDETEEPQWSGSLLAFPYNVDVADTTNPDVALVEYIGRQHPVTYYGTQIGASAQWSATIPKSDKELIYGLRRLSKWMGDVYVREPSGSGYWAHIKVSFPLKHCDVTVPVSFDITRVEGGI